MAYSLTGAVADIAQKFAGDLISGAFFSRVKLAFGIEGVATDVSDTNPLPVSLSAANLAALEQITAALASGSIIALDSATLAALENITVALDAGSLAALESITAVGPLTDAQLRAVAVPVSGAVTANGGQFVSFAATIASGQSLSGAIDLGTARLFAIDMSAAWSAAGLTFQASIDGTVWDELVTDTGAAVGATVAASQFVRFNVGDWLGIRYLRIRSGTAAAPVAQAAARTLTIVAVP